MVEIKVKGRHVKHIVAVLPNIVVMGAHRSDLLLKHGKKESQEQRVFKFTKYLISASDKEEIPSVYGVRIPGAEDKVFWKRQHTAVDIFSVAFVALGLSQEPTLHGLSASG